VSTVEVRVPDLGDVKGVSGLDVLVKKGDKVAVEDPLISLESDKAAMDVPSPVAGVISSVEIKKGDAVSSGTLIAMVEPDTATTAKGATPAQGSAPAQAPSPQTPDKAGAPAAASPAPAKTGSPASSPPPVSVATPKPVS